MKINPIIEGGMGGAVTSSELLGTLTASGSVDIDASKYKYILIQLVGGNAGGETEIIPTDVIIERGFIALSLTTYHVIDARYLVGAGISLQPSKVEATIIAGTGVTSVTFEVLGLK